MPLLLRTLPFLLIIFISLEIHAQSVAETEFKVSGNCDMCKKTIEQSVNTKPGVKSATWNKGTKKIKLVYNPAIISEEQLHQYIAAAGYDTEKMKANDAAYSNLHHCCQYKRTLHK